MWQASPLQVVQRYLRQVLLAEPHSISRLEVTEPGLECTGKAHCTVHTIPLPELVEHDNC